MDQSLCNRCKQKSLVRDISSSSLICSTCGYVQQSDDFRSYHEAGFSEPAGTFVRSCVDPSTSNYRERKIFLANNQILDITSKLNLSASTSQDITNMITTVTDGEFGQGNWFPILIAATAYIVMRKKRIPSSISKVAAMVESDIHEVGRMVNRVTKFLELNLPEFDMVASLEHVLRDSSSFSSLAKEKVDVMIKQGRFLLVCCVKWFLTTGRQPLPVIAGVLTFVAEVNMVEVAIEEIAKDLGAGITTSKLRYKELKETLLKASQVLPWGKDINVKNLVHNAPAILRYMEMKSKPKPKPSFSEGETSLVTVEFDLQEAVSGCLRIEAEYTEYGYSDPGENDSIYFEMESQNGTSENLADMEKLKLSQECLSKTYREFNDLGWAKLLGEEVPQHYKKKRRRGSGLLDCMDWWGLKSDSNKNLSLEMILKKNVGFDALPPSFVAGREACKRRREKITAAKLRINEIMQPKAAVLGLLQVASLSENLLARKGCNIDWEDCIIELLLLHQVNEDQIEQGHYNALLDLHVFNFLENNKKTTAL